MFYKEKYIAAFSEESDPTHVQQVYASEEEAKQFLWTSYSKAVWRECGGWNENGAHAIPQHYSEQALIRIWAWGVGPHIILNRRRAGVAIILNGPFLFFFLCAWWGITCHKPMYLASFCASFVALVLV